MQEGKAKLEHGAKEAAGGPFENLRQNWKPMPGHGKWTIAGDTQVRQSVDDAKVQHSGNTGFTRGIAQSGIMEYEWSVNAASLKQGCGFFIMATDDKKEERGDAYLIWLNANPKPALAVMKIVDNKPPVEKARFDVLAAEGKFNDIKVRYNANTGEFVVSCNSKEAGTWKDAQPYKKGAYVSFTTCLTAATIRNVKIAKAE